MWCTFMGQGSGTDKNRALGRKSSTSHPPFNWAPGTLLGRKPTFQQLTEESSVSPICNVASFLFLVPSTLFFIIFFL